jgi:hypothetical protein
MTALDRIMPSFDHRERHSRWVDAPPAAAWEGLQEVGFDELPIMRLLLALRDLPKRLLGRAERAPTGSFLTGFQARGFTVLAEEPARELVVGSIARYWKPAGVERTPVAGTDDFLAFADPGWAKAATDLRLEPERGGTLISTETRVLATDARARRAFTAYWILIRLPSGLVRRDLLRAIAGRAEGETTGGCAPRARRGLGLGARIGKRTPTSARRGLTREPANAPGCSTIDKELRSGDRRRGCRDSDERRGCDQPSTGTTPGPHAGEPAHPTGSVVS